MKRTFKAADGRRIVKSQSMIEQEEMISLASIMAPILMTVVFCFAAGIF